MILVAKYLRYHKSTETRKPFSYHPFQSFAQLLETKLEHIFGSQIMFDTVLPPHLSVSFTSAPQFCLRVTMPFLGLSLIFKVALSHEGVEQKEAVQPSIATQVVFACVSHIISTFTVKPTIIHTPGKFQQVIF